MDAVSEPGVASAAFGGWTPNDPPYRRVTVALFLGGAATFAMAYAPQPLLPVLRQEFGVTPASATLAISVTTGAMGLALLGFGPWSDAVGRVRVMRATLLVAAVVAVVTGLAGSWEQVLVLRALQGVAIAGLPAVAAAYLREELHPDWVASATGLYIGGTASGGMVGRLAAGALADWLGWRWALVGVGAASLAIAVALWLLLPAPRRFHPSPLRLDQLAANARRMVADRGLVTLYVVGFAAMGAFVALFNGLAFRLAAPPFALSVGVAGLFYLVVGFGSVSSPVAGRLVARLGARRVLLLALAVELAGIAATLLDHPVAVAVGMAGVAVGLFAAHGVTSGWVSSRAAGRGPGTALAGSLYLACYYAGSSVMGTAAGSAWTAGAWPAVAGLGGALIVGALLLAWSLRRRSPESSRRPLGHPR